MDNLVEILLFSDIENRIKKIKNRIANCVKYDEQILKFSFLLNINNFPILRNTQFNGKICFIDWILKDSVVFLSLNMVYLYSGAFSYIEALTNEGNAVMINYDGNLRTFSGVRFKREIDVDKIDKVNVFMIDEFIIRRLN